MAMSASPQYLTAKNTTPHTIYEGSLSHIYNFEGMTKIIPPMIEMNTSKFKDIDNEVIINKISKAAKELNYTNDIMTFIQQMISLSLLLRIYDSPLSTTPLNKNVI